jgi:hypothetical protein
MYSGAPDAGAAGPGAAGGHAHSPDDDVVEAEIVDEGDHK